MEETWIGQSKSVEFELKMPIEVRLRNGREFMGWTKWISSKAVMFCLGERLDPGIPVELVIWMPGTSNGAECKVVCAGWIVSAELDRMNAHRIGATIEDYDFVRVEVAQ